MISGTLIMLALISATTTVTEKSAMAARFGIAFLGLFSSLALYLHGLAMTGLVLLITSSILLPCILPRHSSATEIADKTSHRFRRSTVVGLATGLGVGALLSSDFIIIELIGLASLGLAMLLFGESLPRIALGSVVLSQAIAVLIVYWNLDLQFVFLFETCRLLLFAYLCRKSGRHARASNQSLDCFHSRMHNIFKTSTSYMWRIVPPTPSEKARTIIMRRAGRDFHSFNVFFRKCGVVVFTALQILGIERHKYLPHWQGFYNPRGYLSAPKQNSRT